MTYLLTSAIQVAEKQPSNSMLIVLAAVGVIGWIAASIFGSIAWYNSKRPVGWENKERPDFVPDVDK